MLAAFKERSGDDMQNDEGNVQEQKSLGYSINQFALLIMWVGFLIITTYLLYLAAMSVPGMDAFGSLYFLLALITTNVMSNLEEVIDILK